MFIAPSLFKYHCESNENSQSCSCKPSRATEKKQKRTQPMRADLQPYYHNAPSTTKLLKNSSAGFRVKSVACAHRGNFSEKGDVYCCSIDG